MANKRSTLTPENCRAPMAMDIQDVVLNAPGGGTDISLGITAATVGQTIKVKAVDTDGKPTAWETVDAPYSIVSVAELPANPDQNTLYCIKEAT